MAPPPAPVKWLFVRVPLRGRVLDRLTDVISRLEATPCERDRAQDLPLRLNHVQGSGALGLQDELPTRMRDRKKPHVSGAMGAQMINYRIDQFPLCGQLGLDPCQAINPIGTRAIGARRREPIPAHQSEGPQHIALTPASVVDRLCRAAGQVCRSICTVLAARPHHLLPAGAPGNWTLACLGHLPGIVPIVQPLTDIEQVLTESKPFILH
jgi:hypothetical protein